MEETVRLEGNKKIIRSMYEYYNNREWDKVGNLLHEDLMKTRTISVDDGYLAEKTKYKRKFMHAIFDSKTTETMKKMWSEMRNKITDNPKEGILYTLKTAGERENITRKIIRMVAENNEVWVKERYSGVGFYENAQYDFEIDYIYFLQDGKIIDIHELSDDFVFYLQLGGLRARTNSREDLIEYLDSLKEIGLLPENVTIEE